jgi:hypothetical protein
MFALFDLEGPTMKLDPEQIKKFERAAYSVYNSVGGDCWGERIPPVGEFVDVMMDQMFCGFHTGLSKEDRELWQQLPRSTQVKIIRAVGP